jgi:hypothetical protein
MAIRRASWLQTRLSGSQVPVSRTRVGVSDRRARSNLAGRQMLRSWLVLNADMGRG